MLLVMQQHVLNALGGFLVMIPPYHLWSVYQVFMHLRVAQYAVSVLQEQLVPIMLPSHQLYVRQDITQPHQAVLTVHYALKVTNVLSPINHQLHVLKERML